MFRLKSHRQAKLRTMKFFTMWLHAFGTHVNKVNIVVPCENMKPFLCVETRKYQRTSHSTIYKCSTLTLEIPQSNLINPSSCLRITQNISDVQQCIPTSTSPASYATHLKRLRESGPVKLGNLRKNHNLQTQQCFAV